MLELLTEFEEEGCVLLENFELGRAMVVEIFLGTSSSASLSSELKKNADVELVFPWDTDL